MFSELAKIMWFQSYQNRTLLVLNNKSSRTVPSNLICTMFPKDPQGSLPLLSEAITDAYQIDHLQLNCEFM